MSIKIRYILLSAFITVSGITHANTVIHSTNGSVIFDDVLSGYFQCETNSKRNTSCTKTKKISWNDWYLTVTGWTRISENNQYRTISDSTELKDLSFSFYQNMDIEFTYNQCINAINLVKAIPEKWDLYVELIDGNLYCEAINQHTALKYYTENQ